MIGNATWMLSGTVDWERIGNIRVEVDKIYEDEEFSYSEMMNTI